MPDQTASDMATVRSNIRPFLFHGEDASWVKPLGNGQLCLRLATVISDAYEKILVRLEPDNEEKRVTMAKEGQQGRLQYWSAVVDMNKDRDQTHYAFKALTDTEQFWLHAAGVSPRVPGREKHFRYNGVHLPPPWVQHQVFYQIFPERFACGDESLSVKEAEYQYLGAPVSKRNWGDLPRDSDDHRCSEFYGGDLLGVQQKLDYVNELGITALYFNPIFVSPSNHKYDTVDYMNVDPHFGGNQAFLLLLQAMKKFGMRIVLDAVFNHTSSHHPFMDKYKEHGEQGAFMNPSSEYRDYFCFEGDQYVSWNGYDSLPKLNLANPDVRQYLWEGEEAVLRKFLLPPFSIDGWRFDVAHMLGEGPTARNNAFYLQELRKAVRKARPDGYVVGEHFYEATTWLQGDQEDGAMNYWGFAHPVRAFFGEQDIVFDRIKISAEDFASWMREARSKIPWQNVLAQLNLLDSHDTRRFFTVIDCDVDVMKLAVTLLFTYPGVPCVYYGDEIGMEGGDDPDCRRTFPWEAPASWNKDLLETYKALAAIRRGNPALQSGSHIDLYAHDDTYCFARLFEDSIVVAGVNRGTEPVSLELDMWKTGIENEKLELLYSSRGDMSEQPVVDGILNMTLPGKCSFVLKHN